MSMFSLSSSLSIIAVFLVSFIWRLLCIPGHKVLTFQLASRSAGDFLFLVFVLPGAWFVLLIELLALIPMYPMRQASHGGAPPYWLAAAQLEAGGRCSMRHDCLSHSLKRPLAPVSTPIERRLITGDCRSTCFAYTCRRSWSVLSRLNNKK